MGASDYRKIFMHRMSLYLIHDQENNTLREPDEEVRKHACVLALKEHKARGRTDFTLTAQQAIEGYHDLCKKHDLMPKLREHEHFVEGKKKIVSPQEQLEE